MNGRVSLWLRSRTFELSLLAMLIAGGATLHRVNAALEQLVVVAQPSGDVGPLPDGSALRVLSLGFDRVVADGFWLRTIYYIGDHRSMDAGYPAADRLAELVTDIDPGFRTVYVVMSGALSALQGNAEAAIALLEKGVQHVDYWKLHFLLGFNYFIEKQEYGRAAREMEIAASKPGGPPYLQLLATRLYASAGEPETALAFIEARLRDEKHESTRKTLEKRYWDLWINRDLAQIDAAIGAHREKTGRAALVMEELVRSGSLEKEPRDPRGGRYRIEAGRAVTDLEHDKLKMHVPYRPVRWRPEPPSPQGDKKAQSDKKAQGQKRE